LELNKIREEEKTDMIKENNFSRGIVKYVSDFVAKQINVAKKGKITHREAIEIALRIEQSILEKKSFEMFIPSEESLKKVLKSLNKETEKHVEVLRKELKNILKK
ncbi:MAG: hypothetical protein PF549_02615, partial [Patescibacteria group bacterium]|nr:hypothetical protein [Patescibacteria group bacterium]